MDESIGSLYISANKNRQRFRLMRTFYVQGRRRQKTVAKLAWYHLGFNDSMSIEQARARVSQLNSENSINRRVQKSIVNTAARIQRDQLCESTFVPESFNRQFIKWLEVNTSGNEKHVEKCKIIWKTAKEIIINLQLLPEQFAANRKQIFRYMTTAHVVDKKKQSRAGYSEDYVRKIISLMNQYGRFCARLSGKYYEPIPSPRGSEKEMINDCYRESIRYRGPSDPLTPDVLADLKHKLPSHQYNWLYLTVWLGLRPIEVRMIISDRVNKYWKLEDGKIPVLSIYQSKLKSLPAQLRWKHIPIKYEEQKVALSIIISGNAKAPIAKKLKIHVKNERLNLYGGRKGFVDLLLERSEPLEAISSWMGHSNVSRTWSVYRNRRKVNYGKPLN